MHGKSGAYSPGPNTKSDPFRTTDSIDANFSMIFVGEHRFTQTGNIREYNRIRTGAHPQEHSNSMAKPKRDFRMVA